MGVCCYTAQIHLISSRWAHTSTKHTLMWPLLVFLWIVLLLVFIDRRQRKTFSPNAPFVQPHYPILGNSLTVAKNLHMMLDMVSLSSHSVLHTRGHTQKKTTHRGQMSEQVAIHKRTFQFKVLGQPTYISIFDPANLEHVLSKNFDNYVKVRLPSFTLWE
jgi:hypothetical protein